MDLFQLVVSSYLFQRFTDYEDTYSAFVGKVGGSLDPTNEFHQSALLEWLNKWGCRQFAKAYHRDAGTEIAEWWREHGKLLPAPDAELASLSAGEIEAGARAYGDLKARRASYRRGAEVAIGPTGASKILFALRPKALLPWDDAIRIGEGYADGSAASYLGYLTRVSEGLRLLEKACHSRGFRLADLPAKLGRTRYTTPPKLIDEYHWLKYTGKTRDLPTPNLVREWLEWA